MSWHQETTITEIIVSSAKILDGTGREFNADIESVTVQDTREFDRMDIVGDETAGQHTYQVKCVWTAPKKREVLARLLGGASPMTLVVTGTETMGSTEDDYLIEQYRLDTGSALGFKKKGIAT